MVEDVPARFMEALTALIGTVEKRIWFDDASLLRQDDGWVLLTTTKFKASWIRSRLSQALERAAETAGLDCPPDVVVQKP
jgi:chromosomal replication initiation ATPase DnaA